MASATTARASGRFCLFFRSWALTFFCVSCPQGCRREHGVACAAYSGPVQWLDDRLPAEMMPRAVCRPSCCPAPCPACCATLTALPRASPVVIGQLRKAHCWCCLGSMFFPAGKSAICQTKLNAPFPSPPPRARVRDGEFALGVPLPCLNQDGGQWPQQD